MILESKGILTSMIPGLLCALKRIIQEGELTS